MCDSCVHYHNVGGATTIDVLCVTLAHCPSVCDCDVFGECSAVTKYFADNKAQKGKRLGPAKPQPSHDFILIDDEAIEVDDHILLSVN